MYNSFGAGREHLRQGRVPTPSISLSDSMTASISACEEDEDLESEEPLSDPEEFIDLDDDQDDDHDDCEKALKLTLC